MGLLKLMGISFLMSLSGLPPSSLPSLEMAKPRYSNMAIEKPIQLTHRDSLRVCLSNNFLGKEAWENNLESAVSETNIPEIVNVDFLSRPDPLERNKKISENYILIFIPEKINSSPLSINAFENAANYTCRKNNKKPAFYRKPNEGSWYKYEDFANSVTQTGEWHLVRREIVPRSFSKDFQKQNKLVSSVPPLEIAGARTLAIVIGMNYLNSGERLFKYPRCARTNDVSSGEYRVAMGLSDTSGTNMLISLDYMKAQNVGIAVEWKLK